jgi:septal ring factor EnvC (AmiA/AmiB activator)
MDVRHTQAQLVEPSAFVPAEFLEDADVADCALDEQLEQLHRQYAAASRAASRARFEQNLLEGRDDIHEHILAQARRRRVAAETRCARLMQAIDALEARLEKN